MSFKLPDDPAEALEYAELAVDGLSAIAQAVDKHQKLEDAAGILAVVLVIIKSVRKAFDDDNDVTPEAAKRALAALTTSLSGNDVAADAALAAKFDKET